MSAATDYTRQVNQEIKDSKALRLRIRELAEGEPDPGVVAEKLLSELTRAEMLVLARAAARNYVRLVMDSAGSPKPRNAEPAPFVPPQRNSSSTGNVSPIGGHPSRKWGAVQDWVARRLETERVYVENLEEWKFLGKCSADDLLSAAQKGYRDAEDVRKNADLHAIYASVMQKAGVELMEDLPRDVLEKVLVK